MRGVELYRAHDYRGAIREFELAAGLVPSADLWFNIARAHQEISEYTLAADYYRRYLRDRPDPPDRAQVEETIAAMEERAEAERQARRNPPTTGQLSIRASVDGSEVALNQRQVGQSPIALPMAMQPGVHRFSVRHDGYIPFQSDVRLSAGVPTTAYADLVPETRYRAIRGNRIFTWIAGGLTVVALGASAYFAIDAAGYDLADEMMRSQAEDAALLSDYAFGAAIGLGVITVVLWFVEGRSIGTERIQPDAPPRTADIGTTAPVDGSASLSVGAGAQTTPTPSQ